MEIKQKDKKDKNVIYYSVYEDENTISFLDISITLMFPKEKKEIIVGKNTLKKFKYFEAIFEFEPDIKEIFLEDNRRDVAIMIDYIRGNEDHLDSENVNSIVKLACKWGFVDENTKLPIIWETIRFLEIDRKEYISILKFSDIKKENYIKIPTFIFECIEKDIPKERFVVLNRDKYKLLVEKYIVDSCSVDFNLMNEEDIEEFCNHIYYSWYRDKHEYCGSVDLLRKFIPNKIKDDYSGSRITCTIQPLKKVNTYIHNT